jgi:hypothetical protein
VFRAVIETNLLGQVHGSRAVLPYFRAQQQGVLINMSSVWGRVTSPDVSAYVTSKFAVRAFSECLRQELSDSPGIDVATVLPQAVDTPIFAHAANYSGRPARPVPPLIDPETIAQGILQCAESPADEITYSRLGRALEALHSLLPSVYQRVIPAAFSAGNYAEGSATTGSGNLLAPIGVHEISGRWRSEHRRQAEQSVAGICDSRNQGLVHAPHLTDLSHGWRKANHAHGCASHVPHRRAPRVLGRTLPRQRPIRRQTPLRTDPQRQQVARDRARRSRPGSDAHQEHLLQAQYQRLRPRIGHGRALGAVKHSMLIAYWHMFTTGEIYRELGGDYFQRRDPERITKRLVARLPRARTHRHPRTSGCLTQNVFPIRRGAARPGGRPARSPHQ